MEKITNFLNSLIVYCKTKLTATTAETISWIGLVLIHASVIPTILTVMAGINDRLPPVDMILLVWGGLTLFFVKAAIYKDMVKIITIGFGFIVHSVLLALLLFK